MSESNGKVLIVDEEKSVRLFLHRLFQREGYSCVSVATGEEALQVASQDEFQIALLHVKMPGVAGLDVLSRLSEAQPDLCVILEADVLDADTLVNARKLGVYDYVTKPLDLEYLVVTVNKAMREQRDFIPCRIWPSP